MVRTYGLTHINLAVRDLGRALRFYEEVFGLREHGRGDGLVHTRASGRQDILTFAEDPDAAGLSGAGSAFSGVFIARSMSVRRAREAFTRKRQCPNWRTNHSGIIPIVPSHVFTN